MTVIVDGGGGTVGKELVNLMVDNGALDISALFPASVMLKLLRALTKDLNFKFREASVAESVSDDTCSK